MKQQPLPAYRLKLARQLRAEQTESERLLWDHLRGGKLDGLKFRRQRPIADSCCDQARLVIEIDGSSHDPADRREYDLIRQRLLHANGYRVLRITVHDVMTHTAAVLQQIRRAAHGLVLSTRLGQHLQHTARREQHHHHCAGDHRARFDRGHRA